MVWPETGDGTIELHLRPVSRVMHCQRCGARCREIHEPLQQHFKGGRLERDKERDQPETIGGLRERAHQLACMTAAYT